MTIDVTVCDCSTATDTDIFKFNENCDHQLPKQLYQDVDYEIWSSRPETITFPATICTRHVRRKQVYTDFVFGTDTVYDTIPLDTTEQECRSLLEFKKCGPRQMVPTDNGGWQHQEEPYGIGSWLRETTFETTNCIVKPINLEKKCTRQNCTIITPFGLINSTVGYHSHNHATIVWDPSWSIINQAHNRKIQKGTGKLYKATNNRYLLLPINKNIKPYLKLIN